MASEFLKVHQDSTEFDWEIAIGWFHFEVPASDVVDDSTPITHIVERSSGARAPIAERLLPITFHYVGTSWFLRDNYAYANAKLTSVDGIELGIFNFFKTEKASA